MEQLRIGFEKALRTKLGQKITATQSEETYLNRCFKHFDSDNDGALSFSEWLKGIEKIGVILPSIDDAKALFEYYDSNQSGAVEYKEFAASLYHPELSKYF